jgi:hypothetical protein
VRGPQYEAAVKKRTDTVLRKIDIGNWQSAVAKQFEIVELPHLKIYSPEGKFIKSGFNPVLLDDPGSAAGDSSGPNWIWIGIYILGGMAILLFILTKALAPPKRYDVQVSQDKHS